MILSQIRWLSQIWRLSQGALEAASFPALNPLVSKWEGEVVSRTLPLCLFFGKQSFWSCPDWLVTFRWVPTSEKPVFLSFAYVGGTFGTIVTYPVGISGQNAKRRNHHQMQSRYYRIKIPQMCGLIIEQLGWEAVFYITAGITVLWVIIWQVRWCVCLSKYERGSLNKS